MPVSAGIVRRHVPGETTESAVEATAALEADGLQVSLDFLGEDTLDAAQADATVAAYVDAARRAGRGRADPRRGGVGEALRHRPGLPDVGRKIALDNARTICRAARNAGTTVTLDMEDHTTTDATLATLRELRKDFPETGAVLQAYLHRTEADCRELAHEGSRVRLCKGAYAEPEEVAFQDRLEVDKSYVRCLKVLLGGQGYPMIATHDPRMIQIARSLASRYGRAPGTSSSRCSTASARGAVAAGRGRRRPCASTCPTARSGTATSCAGSPSARQNLTFFLRSLSRSRDRRRVRPPTQEQAVSRQQTAIIGAGVMGEALLSGLVRGRAPGRPAAGRREAPRAGRRARGAVRRRRRGQPGGCRAAPRRCRSWSSPRTWPRCSPRSAPSCGPDSWSSPRRRHHDSLHRGPGARGRRGGAGHAQHPGPRRRGDDRDLPGVGLRGGRPGRGRDADGLGGPGAARARAAARRRHRPSPGPVRPTSSSSWSR